MTKSQTRTMSWRTTRTGRKVSEDSDFTCSTVYTDKEPTRRGRQTGRMARKEDRRNE